MKSLVMGAVMALGFAVSAQAQDVTGMWQSQPGETGSYIHVEIGGCSGASEQRCGMIRAAFDGNGNQIESDIVGKPIISGMQDDGNGSFSGGTIWAPDNDKTYSSKMELNGNTLAVSGCVLFICRSQDWTRLN